MKHYDPVKNKLECATIIEKVDGTAFQWYNGTLRMRPPAPNKLGKEMDEVNYCFNKNYSDIYLLVNNGFDTSNLKDGVIYNFEYISTNSTIKYDTPPLTCQMVLLSAWDENFKAWLSEAELMQIAKNLSIASESLVISSVVDLIVGYDVVKIDSWSDFKCCIQGRGWLSAFRSLIAWKILNNWNGKTRSISRLFNKKPFLMDSYKEIEGFVLRNEMSDSQECYKVFSNKFSSQYHKLEKCKEKSTLVNLLCDYIVENSLPITTIDDKIRLCGNVWNAKYDEIIELTSRWVAGEWDYVNFTTLSEISSEEVEDVLFQNHMSWREGESNKLLRLIFTSFSRIKSRSNELDKETLNRVNIILKSQLG